jgi:hypothetical protein
MPMYLLWRKGYGGGRGKSSPVLTSRTDKYIVRSHSKKERKTLGK